MPDLGILMMNDSTWNQQERTRGGPLAETPNAVRGGRRRYSVGDRNGSLESGSVDGAGSYSNGNGRGVGGPSTDPVGEGGRENSKHKLPGILRRLKPSHKIIVAWAIVGVWVLVLGTAVALAISGN